MMGFVKMSMTCNLVQGGRGEIAGLALDPPGYYQETPPGVF